MQFQSTSSLVKVADYQNASIYLDLAGNTAFASFKVVLMSRLFIFTPKFPALWLF